MLFEKVSEIGCREPETGVRAPWIDKKIDQGTRRTILFLQRHSLEEN